LSIIQRRAFAFFRNVPRGTFFPIRESLARIRRPSLTNLCHLQITHRLPVANYSLLPVTFGKWNIPAIAAKPRSRKGLPSARTAVRRRFASFPLKPSPSGLRRQLPISRRNRFRRPCLRRRNLRRGHRVRPTRLSPPPFAGTWRGKARCCAAWAQHFSRLFLSSRSVAAFGCSEPARFPSPSIRSAPRRP